MLIVLLDEPGLFVFSTPEAAANSVEAVDAASEIRAAFDDFAVPYCVEWVTPPHRKVLFGRFESDGPAVYRFVPAGPPDRAALIALLDAHSDYTDPPEAQASVLALRDTLRS